MTVSTLSRLTDAEGPTNVAPTSDRFIGRDGELSHLLETLAAGRRLLTLAGPGGIGKTRLAREAGLASTEEFVGGVWFVDLSEAATLHDITASVSDVLGAKPAPDQGAVDGLLATLQGRGRALLILDNLEQIVDVAADVVQRWLEGAPRVAVLATSRERLGVQGEEVHTLEPLSAEGAAELFVERVGSDAQLDGVAELVGHLDHLPLAIELAASHAESMSPAEMLRSLDRLSTMHVSGDLPARQSTLESTVAWSWDLLEDQERSALAQFVAFRGGFTLAAAGEVVELPPALMIERVVHSLVRKSMLRLRVADAERRFGLFVSVRAFVEGRADPDLVDAARRRHLAWFARQVQERAVHEYAGDLDNLVDAVRFGGRVGAGEAAVVALGGATEALTRNGLTEAAIGLCRELADVATLGESDRDRLDLALGTALRLQCLHDTAAELGRRLLARALERSDPAIEGEARYLLARALRDHPDEAWDHCEAALELARDRGDDRLEALVCMHLGNLAGNRVSLDEAVRHFEDGLAAARRTGDPGLEATVLLDFTLIHRRMGRFDEARRSNERGLTLALEAGDRRGESTALSGAGLIEWAAGDLRQAALLMARASEHHLRFSNARAIAITKSNEALVQFLLGDIDASELLLDQSIEALEDVQEPGLRVTLERHRAEIELGRGQVQEAVRYYEESLEATLRQGTAYLAADIQIDLAAVLLDLGRRDEAETLLSEAWVVAEVGSSALRASCLRQRALLALADGRTSDALTLIGDALACQPGKHGHYERARELIVRGRCRLQAQDPDGATADFEEATGILAPLRLLPSSLMEQELRALRAELGISTPLHVATDLSWVQPYGRPPVPLGRKATLRRVLRRLVDARLEAPGEAVPREELVAAGWPGDRSSFDALLNRLHVAMHGLRSLGLGEVVLRRDDGYLLDPSVPLERVGR